MAESVLTGMQTAIDHSGPRRDLYEEEMYRYRETLERDWDLACQRYGFVLFHSLSGLEAVRLRKNLGLSTREATDIYNLGFAAAQDGQFAEAIKRFREALKADPELAEAEFNLALAQEKAGDKAEAKKQWKSYLKRETLSEEERAAVEGHLQEL